MPYTSVAMSSAEQYDQTALFRAVRENKENMVEKLIKLGADINAKGEDGETCLLYAVKEGKKGMVQKLIDHGADINAADKNGLTALFYVVLEENGEMVEKLIECGANVNAKDEDGQTCLFYAVGNENEEIIKKIMACAVDINATNKNGLTALFYAVHEENERMVKKLIECGADINAKSKDGETCLFYAVKEGKEEMVETLIACGADINASNKFGATSLFYAVEEDVIQKLVELGADITAKDNDGETCLFYAATEKKGKTVEKLIELGADINAKTDKNGKTALIYAVQKEKEKNVDKLIELRADINVNDKHGKTALFYAVRKGNEKITQKLVDCGADINATDKDGKTALFYAMKKSLSLAKYLIGKGATLYLNENCSVLTFFIEKCIFSLSERKTNLRDGVKLLSQCSDWVKDKTVLEAIVSVTICKTLCFKPGSCDIDVDTLSKLMKLARENTPTFKMLFPVGKNKIITEISNIIHKERHMPLIDSRAALKLLRLLIKLGANPNTTDSDGNTALHHATQLTVHGVTRKSVMKICQQLQKLNVCKDITNHQNQTPLLYCLTTTIEKVFREEEPWKALKTQAAVCRFLVEHGSSVEVKTGRGETVLHLAIDLLQQGFSKRNSELRKDISDVSLELLEVFVLAFKRRNVSTNTQDNSGNTPLHLWAKLQLAPGQDYNNTITTQESMFSYKLCTFQKCLKKILKMLGENKHLKDKNKNAQTPLHCCRTWTAVELLLNTAGADKNAVDSSGRPPLLAAAANMKPLQHYKHFYPDVLQEPKAFWKMAVIEKGLNPWTADKQSESVMSILIEAESFDLAEGMVEFACEDNNLDSPNSIIFSLLLAICNDKSTSAHKKTDLLQIILRSGKCAVSGTEGEDSPLHFCCRNIVRNPHDVNDVQWATAKLLLLHDADKNISDSSGQSCLDIAKGCPKLKELLLKPVDIDEFPLRMEWKSISKVHKDKLANTARERQSKHVQAFWYHRDYLACGSLGAVFAGINENDGREVAIKRIEKIRLQRPEDKQEIISLTVLADCEQVVRYLFFFEDENFSYIVLELMEGNLNHFLDNGISTDSKVSLCQDVVKGVKFLHDHHIIHRDLKPSNILYKVHPKPCFKLADFGLSRSIDSTGSSTSVHRSHVGTRCWTAPEVLMSKKAPSESASDVFACGLVLHYFLSVKTHPFIPPTGALQHEIEANILKGKMEGWDDSLCPEAAHLLRKMLDRDESKRPSADKALDHPLFWTKKKNLELLNAVGNQKEFGFTRAKRTSPLTAVETDLENSFGTIVKYVDWNDPGYVHMPAIYTQMTTRRGYNTNSSVELVRFIRNAYAHVTGLPKSIQDHLLKDFVFLEYFPNLVMEVYKAVTTHGWDQTRKEIKHALQ